MTSEAPAADVKTSVPAQKPERHGRGVLRRLLKNRLAFCSFTVVMLYLAAAFGAEAYSIWCSASGAEPVYNLRDEKHAGEAPSKRHILGTDYLGRDVFLRGIFASRTAVKVGLVASLIAMTAGVGLGMAAGCRGGTVDDIVVWIYSTFASIPSLLFILAFALLASKGFMPAPVTSAFNTCAKALNTEPGMLAVYLGIGLTGWVTLCRVVRAEAMRLRETQYVMAAKVLGENQFAIMFRHIFPNLAHLVIIYFTLQFAQAVMAEVIVSYLGLGVQFEPSWGRMIADGQERLWRGIWWEVGAATGFMFFLVLALNILGDALRDALDPRING